MGCALSGITPNFVLQQAIFAEGGIIVDTKDFKKYMLDLNGWFMWWGEMYELHGKSLGAGLTKITATVKYPAKMES